jgi:hypothetical protein
MARLFAFGLAVATTFFAGAGRAFADTVDAAAKPYMVVGGFIAAVIFIGGGFYTIWVGRDRRRIARESPNWPQADGKILTATVATRWHPTVGSYYVPRAYYSYAVAGTTYQGDVIRAGLEQFGSITKEAAQTHIQQYPVGSRVTVHYNPAAPASAVLETTVMGGGRNIFAGAIFVLLGIAAFVFAVWTAGLEPS